TAVSGAVSSADRRACPLKPCPVLRSPHPTGLRSLTPYSAFVDLAGLRVCFPRRHSREEATRRKASAQWSRVGYPPTTETRSQKLLDSQGQRPSSPRTHGQ